MEKRTHRLAGTAVLALALLLVACGQGQVQNQGPATLEVACVPPAEVWIDGTSKGTTPQKLTLDAGEHQVVLKRDLFESHEGKIDLKSGETAQVDVALQGTDPGDPEVIRVLNELAEIEQEPFEEGERHRGVNDNGMAVLLWPKKDVRTAGLTVFGIEVSMDYMGDGFLEFKKGRKVLYREPFEPERVTTIAAIPASVLEAVKSGDSVTWGLVFEKKRDNVTAKFKVVKGTAAGKALEKLERRKFFQRQPPLTKALMRAQVLQNKRLYTESLLANLAASQAFPTSTQPYQGIATSLRRIDGKNSELWAVTSQYVLGRGQGGGRARPQAGPGRVTQPAGAPPLKNWHPGPGAVRGEPALLGAGGAVRPGIRPVQEQPTTPGATDPGTAPADPTQPTPPISGGGDIASLRESVRRLEAELQEPRRAADDARRHAAETADGATAAASAATTAAKALADAEAQANEAEQAFLNDSSDANNQALEEAKEQVQRRAEEAAHTQDQAARAQEEAAKATGQLRRQERELANRERELDNLRDAIAQAQAGGAPVEPTPGQRRGSDPAVTQPGPRDPTVSGGGRQPGRQQPGRDGAMSRNLADARSRYADGQTSLNDARTRLADLEAHALEMLKTGDESYPEALQQAEDARTQLRGIEAQAQDHLQQYAESLKGLGSTNLKAVEAAAQLDQNQADVARARDGVTRAEEAFQQDTSDAALLEELVQARKRLQEAETALSETLEAYQAAVGD